MNENINIVFLERDEVLKLHRYEKFNKSNKDHEKYFQKKIDWVIYMIDGKEMREMKE